jgi:hypothetical protein
MEERSHPEQNKGLSIEARRLVNVLSLYLYIFGDYTMHHPVQQPSEKFLLTQRMFTFLDEWLFYGLLTLLYFNGKMESDPFLFWAVAVLGGSFMVISYVKQWFMEAMRFETKNNKL